MNNVSASASLAQPQRSHHPLGAAPEERHLNIDESSPEKQAPSGQTDQLLTERAITLRTEPDTLFELKHDQYGKMSETINHWLTQRHPAFAPFKGKPKNVARILGSKQLSSATNIWVVTEKVHGSNFSFVCSPPTEHGAPPTVRCAKREEFLNENSDEDNTSFFGFRKVKNRYQAAAEQAYTTIAKRFTCNGITTTPSDEVVRLTIYGELFGGTFPGLPSPPDGISAVQEGVYYHPDLDFMAFGAAVTLRPPVDQPDVKQADMPVTLVELDFLPTMEMLKSCGFFTAEALHLGSFNDCCNFDINFTTTIPGRLGVDREAMKKIAATNLAEGIVCRTNIAQTVPVTGNKPDDHCLFKRKRDDFASYCCANAQGIAGEQNRSLVSGDKTSFLHCIDKMVRSRLVDSALSKTGKPITKNQKANKRLCQRAAELVLADVKEEVSAITFSLTSGAPGKKPVKAHKTSTRHITVSGDRLLEQYNDDIERIIADALQELAIR